MHTLHPCIHKLHAYIDFSCDLRCKQTMYVVFSFFVRALLPLPPPHPTRAHSAAAAAAAAPPKAAAAPTKAVPTPTTAAPVKVENVAPKPGASILNAVLPFS